MHMGKVISLKLKKKEERIINRLNQEGITNSDLMREALWYYFTTINDDVNPNINPVYREENDKFFHENILRLKNEVNILREENNKIQKVFQEEIKNIYKLFDKDLPAVNLTKKEPFIGKEKHFSDFHAQIDEFLRKKETQYFKT